MNPPRTPKQGSTSKESQRSSASAKQVSVTTASKPSAQRSTTFLTKDDTKNRAASAYHVEVRGDTIGNSQRARQEHSHGPTVTRNKNAVHAFIPENGKPEEAKRKQKAVSKVTKDMVKSTGMDPQTAMRLNIMDGLAEPTASANAQHIEAFSSPVGRGNPHRSGGTVKFPEPQSNLSKFDLVSATTQQMKKEVKSTGHTTTKPITDTVSNNPSSAQQFNSAALAEQRRFAQSILNPKKE
ncbi:hypothetical protein [Alteromonas sp. a30]|uniref:hypothetical protein n=1 Tax=Alteromonas sp. a30 TaxID=2730917 RepID=UPI002281C4C4|nr:hypothetical protein [Alteromonas sp. a30]MCY7293835.1 hypothetical protein [Alteromonas sp. a30]